MVKVFNMPGQRVTRRHEGIMHTATLAGGRVVFKKWPRKRGKTAPGPVADMRKAFAWAAKASVYAIPQDKAFAELITKGSMYYPRDALISAMYGTLFEVRLKNGTIYRSARLATKDVQTYLDQISTIPGTMLVRGATEWIALATGDEGDFLAAHGPGLIPTWEPGTGGGGGAPLQAIQQPPIFDPAEDGSAYATGLVTGVPFFTTGTVELTGVRAYVKTVNGAVKIAPTLYGAAANNLMNGGPLLATGPFVTPVAGQINSFPFDTPVAVDTDKLVYLGLSVQGGTNISLSPSQQNRYFRVFTLASGSPPATAPSTTNGTGTNVGIWAY